ncbi:hypothetical protein BDV34DRAFT_100161 [Aspergillus parasiticus]|uniref:Uncharacterized protein n=1 Tax=Aspergillus parasiticus TaxID=5067 RepID=A0A5N6DN18_ASPPA|nr:hypothetical protein BDV34DRAFT_100161 [Aspergillus parasiticus]
MSSTVHGGMSVYVVLDFIGKSRLRYYYLSSRRHSVRHQLCDHLNPVRKPKEKKKKKKKGRTSYSCCRRSAVASWIFLLLIRSKHRTNWRQGRKRHDIYLNVVIPRIVRWVSALLHCNSSGNWSLSR